MSDLRQMSLFPDEPLSPDEINRHTPLNATMKLFRQHLKKEGKSEHTIKAFESDLNLVAEYLDGKTPVGQFTTNDLNQFLDWLENGRGIPCSRKSYARRVTTLKVYFKWLRTLNAIPIDPAQPVLQRSGPAPLSEVLSEVQIRAAIDAAQSMNYKKTKDQDYRPELLLRLLLDTGIKKSETTRLTPDDVDTLNYDQPILLVRQKARNVYRERRINLDPEWVKLLDLYLDQYNPKEVIFNCTARNLEYILTEIGTRADIPFKLSFEVMRWTCGVQDYRMGMDERDLREKMGLSEVSWHETGSKIKRLAQKLAEEESA